MGAVVFNVLPPDSANDGFSLTLYYELFQITLCDVT